MRLRTKLVPFLAMVASLPGCFLLLDYRPPASRAQSRPGSRPQSQPDTRVAQVSWLQAPPESTGWTPIELSLAEGVALGDLHTDVYGLRVGLFSSEDRSVHGLDLHLGLSGALDGGSGLAVALVRNATLREFVGVQVAGVVNWQTWGWEHPSSLWGAQISPLANVASSLHGLQVGAINGAVRATGAQIGILSMSSHLQGLAVGGLLGFTEHGSGVLAAPITFCPEGFTGVQIGVLNIADSGVQIGLLNWNKHGFLPVFPLFNF